MLVKIKYFEGVGEMSHEIEKDRYVSNSLVRGLEILRLFSGENPTLSLAQIATKLGVSRNVPYRLVYTLQKMGYLAQDPETKRYSLTPKVLELGFAYLNNLQLPEIAAPYLKKLKDETGASVHMGILDGKEVVYVAREAQNGISTFQVHINIGSRLPAYATSLGKALLAYQSPEYLEKIFQGVKLQPYTKQTKTQIEDLKQELKEIREQGYAFSNEEFEIGIKSIAAPVFNRSREAIASVNVVIPASIATDERLMGSILPRLLKTTKELSFILP